MGPFRNKREQGRLAFGLVRDLFGRTEGGGGIAGGKCPESLAHLRQPLQLIGGHSEFFCRLVGGWAWAKRMSWPGCWRRLWNHWIRQQLLWPRGEACVQWL